MGWKNFYELQKVKSTNTNKKICYESYVNKKARKNK